MRVLYFGMAGILSRLPFEALMAAGHEICGVVMPAEEGSSAPVTRVEPPPIHSAIPLLTPFATPTIRELAWTRQIPVLTLGNLHAPEALSACSKLQPDVACVSCFPLRIPAALLQLVPLGFLNLHPSLLPAYRGPAPLFWTFREGCEQTGVTIHLMDEGLDTGPLLLQAPVPIPAGIRGEEAEQDCATVGSTLMVQALAGLQKGSIVPRPQPLGGSSQPWPTAHDCTFSTDWSARRAFAFLRGTEHWGLPYTVVAGDTRLSLRRVLSYDEQTILPEPYLRQGKEVLIQLNPGVIRANED